MELFASADSVNMSLGLLNHLEHILDIMPKLRNTKRGTINSAKKSSQAFVLGKCVTCGGDMLVADAKELQEKSRPRVWQGPERGEEHSGDHPGEEDDKTDLAEQEIAMEARNDFGSISGTLFHVVRRTHTTLDVL